ncbi:MAG: hypothetical protein K0R41_146 [Geminicoccaceae bacterium]|jgi:hypothetical protein|nr:hypothetical protein [Solirubrobacterales bacterium]MCE3246321.1 hypothetical protein [Geminicoccaceae bacterium]
MKLALVLLIALVIYLLAVPVLDLPVVLGLILAVAALVVGLVAIGYTIRVGRQR